MRYTDMRVSMAPSLISSVGMCGRKSLPTKKHMKTAAQQQATTGQPPSSSGMALPAAASTRQPFDVCIDRSRLSNWRAWL